MSLSTEDRQTTQCAYFVVDLDVDTASRHIGRDGYGTFLSRIFDDLRFLEVVFGIEYIVRDLLFFETLVDHFGLFDRGGTDEDRLSFFMVLSDFSYDCIEFLSFGVVDQVVLVDTAYGYIGRDGDDIETVDLGKLGRFGLCRTGHTGKLVVESEVVLVGDLRKGL